MFDTVAHSALGFWIVAIVIVVADSALFVPSGRFTFAIGDRLTVKIRIVEYPYLLLGNEPILTLITYTVAPFFISSMDQSPQGRQVLKQLLLRQKRIMRDCQQLSILALISLVLICVVGPLLSLRYGVERALLTTAPLAYANAGLGAATIYFNRSVCGLKRNDLAHIGLELLFCPILLVNIFKRIAIRQPEPCTTDLIKYFSQHQAEIAAQLARHVEAVEQ